MPLQIRRGTQAERSALTVPLASGELLYVTDDQRLYIGNGTTLGGVQVTGYNDEDSQEATAQLFLGPDPILAPDNTNHVGISFVYDDNANRISATVDFSTVDSLVADAFQGSVFADDSTLLVDAVDGTFNLNGTIKGNIVPNISEVHDIGTPTAKFKDLYLSGSSLFLGDASITASGTAINLPAGSTVGGIEIGLATESIVRDVVGSIIGEDSTILVDATSNTISTGRININENTISALGDEAIVRILGSNTPFERQTQVLVPVLSSATTTSIYDALMIWKMLTITAYKDIIGQVATEMAGGEVTGVISIGGYQPNAGPDGEGKAFSGRMGMQVDPAGTTTSTYIPTKLFWVNQPATELLAEDDTNHPIMTFDSLGRLAVNKETAQATLDVNGFAKLAILDEEPASPANGMIAIADGDAIDGWDPLGNGKQSMVVRLGGAWVQIAAAAP